MSDRPTRYATEAQLSYLRTMASKLGERWPSEYITRAEARRLIDEWKPRYDRKRLREHPLWEIRRRLAKRLRADGARGMERHRRGGSR